MDLTQVLYFIDRCINLSPPNIRTSIRTLDGPHNPSPLFCRFCDFFLWYTYEIRLRCKRSVNQKNLLLKRAAVFAFNVTSYRGDVCSLGGWILYDIYRDPSFAPFLIIFIPVAIYSIAYYYALTDTCVITSEAGIEYKRPEFSIVAAWSQIKSLKHNPILSIFGVNHYLLLEAPTISYTKWLGSAYKFQLGHILFRGQQKRIPIGKMWESSKELENEIRTKVPSLAFESSRGRVAS